MTVTVISNVPLIFVVGRNLFPLHDKLPKRAINIDHIGPWRLQTEPMRYMDVKIVFKEAKIRRLIFEPHEFSRVF